MAIKLGSRCTLYTITNAQRSYLAKEPYKGKLIPNKLSDTLNLAQGPLHKRSLCVQIDVIQRCLCCNARFLISYLSAESLLRTDMELLL